LRDDGAINHLEEVDQGANVSIEVGISARSSDSRTGEAIRRGSASKTEKLDQRSVAEVVGAMSREVGSMANMLVSSMQSTSWHVRKIKRRDMPDTNDPVKKSASLAQRLPPVAGPRPDSIHGGGDCVSDRGKLKHVGERARVTGD
jgi:hypothetical protein